MKAKEVGEPTNTCRETKESIGGRTKQARRRRQMQQGDNPTTGRGQVRTSEQSSQATEGPQAMNQEFNDKPKVQGQDNQSQEAWS